MAQYYDIDDILAEDELVPAIFQEAANGVGLFYSSDDTNKVEQGSKVELPLWLARELHLRQAAAINVPHCFNKKTRDEIEADGAHVDLRNRCQYFYELGYKIAPLVSDKTIGSFLLFAFQTRYKEVLIKAHTAALSVASKFLSILTKEEAKLYEAAQSSMTAFKKWRMGGPRFQKASVLGRKRKPIE
ncbi:DNA replication complex GINS protein PSF3-like [Cornus florida]|uniref:DNA replication complex GINS protein PSF3-like n=1 Tax=Cornus florida TaxID=4283 RepID=UPI002896A128|nr:DNA replication complex GINS protein PSF3-like [Cornus florida]